VDPEIPNQVMVALSVGAGAALGHAATGVGAAISDLAKSTVVLAGKQLRAGLVAMFRGHGDEDSVKALEHFDANPLDDGARRTLAGRLDGYDLAMHPDFIDAANLINAATGNIIAIGRGAVALGTQTNHAETGGAAGNFAGPVKAGYRPAKIPKPTKDRGPDPRQPRRDAAILTSAVPPP